MKLICDSKERELRRIKKKLWKGSGLDAWRNVGTPLDLVDLAEAYCTETLPAYATLAGAICAKFRTDVQAAKRMYAEVPVTEFSDVSQLFCWRQFGALFLKSGAGASTRPERVARALSTFVKGEERCKRYNKKLAHYFSYPNRMPQNIRVILARAKEEIRQLLGPLDERALWSLLLCARPGSGTAIGTRVVDAVGPAFKLGHTDRCVTASALPYAQALCEATLRNRITAPEFRVVNYNRLSTVPKDSGTDRTIAIEPAENVWLQLGVHEDWKVKLLSWGITLADQSRNQQAAQRGSSGWRDPDGLVTLDQSNASGHICRELVRYLLPSDWCGYLDDIRSRYWTYEGGDPVEYQGWSSMGNGYTFVLQCLIFGALVRATLSLVETENTYCVYGDDVILPKSASLLFMEVGRFVGFVFNTDKSYIFSPFRESCGGDFFAGIPVTPVYVRGTRVVKTTEVYRIINGLRAGLVKPTSTITKCFAALRGQVIAFCLPGHDATAGVFTDLQHLRSIRQAAWFPAEQRWVTFTTVWKPIEVRHAPEWALATKLMPHPGYVDAFRVFRDSRRGNLYVRFQLGSFSCPSGVPTPRTGDDTVERSARRGKGHWALVVS